MMHLHLLEQFYGCQLITCGLHKVCVSGLYYRCTSVTLRCALSGRPHSNKVTAALQLHEDAFPATAVACLQDGDWFDPRIQVTW